jgi:hypothetical protein
MIGATVALDPTQTTPPQDGNVADASGTTDDSGSNGADATPAMTVEELDRQWRHRVSQKDRAHAAAEQALRDETESLRRQLQAQATTTGQSGTQGQNGGGDPTVTALREELARKNREVEEERSLRTIESRKAKYPALAQQVGEAGSSVFSTADDATLARLNALADDNVQGSPMASNSPRKPAPGQPKDMTQMSKSELEEELRKSVARGDHNRP